MEASERRLRRFEVVDRQGFGRPVVFQVAAEDRRHGLELFPASYFVWFDEPSAEVMYG